MFHELSCAVLQVSTTTSNTNLVLLAMCNAYLHLHFSYFFLMFVFNPFIPNISEEAPPSLNQVRIIVPNIEHNGKLCRS